MKVDIYTHSYLVDTMAMWQFVKATLALRHATLCYGIVQCRHDVGTMTPQRLGNATTCNQPN